MPDAAASMVLSVEPMESLRYAGMLRPDGWIVTDVTPLKNVPDYPDPARLFDVLFSVPRLVAVDAGALAHRAGTVKAHNTVMLGAAAPLLPVPPALLEKHLRSLFAAKGARIVAANVDAFRMGEAASRFAVALVAGGVAGDVVARVVPRLAFEPQPVAPELVAGWVGRLLAPGAGIAAARMFASTATLAPDAGLAALSA